ncbi:MAG: hypothetical protein D6753_04700 [Planctomycetota bacterium]|nr:MAG: hypothetical protein D6753_04700 [Planctomycetota bacterium]
MGIRFQCPTCKVVRAANERLLGRQIKCPECGGPVRLPTREQILEGRRAQLAARKSPPKVPATVVSTPAVQTARSLQAEVLGPGDADWDGDAEEQAVDPEEKELAAARTTFRKPKQRDDGDMDMTPMVDVTFLLLIFFMITASFSVQKAFKTPAQKRDDPSMNPIEQPEDENPDIVTVQIDEFNAYNVITTDWDRPAGSKQDLIVLLSQAFQGDSSGNQPSKVVIQAHEDCIHAAVVDALDAGREAHFESFEVSTVEQFD